MATISNLDKVGTSFGETSHQVAGGYVMGFLIGFAGVIAVEIIAGRGHSVWDDEPGWRWFSYFMIGVVLVLGFAGWLAQTFGNPNHAYIVGSVVGGFVVSVGLGPILKRLDGR